MEHIATALAGSSLPSAGAEPGTTEPVSAYDGGPMCPYCHGYRWVRHDVPVEHPRFGKPERCEHCRDWATATLLNQRAADAGLCVEDMRKRFDMFTPSKLSKAAFDAARAFAADPDGWLVIHGAVGSGKTHLALAIANARLHNGLAVRFWYTSEFLLRLRLERQEDRSPDAMLLRVRDLPLVILDDLWSARPTEWVLESLEQLFNHRYVHRLPTVVTMIGSPEDVKQSDSESIGRRMQDVSLARVVRNDAPQWKGG